MTDAETREFNALVAKLEAEMGKTRDLTADVLTEQTKVCKLSSELVDAQGQVARLRVELAQMKNAAPEATPDTLFEYVLDPKDRQVRVKTLRVPILTDQTLKDSFPWGAGKYWEARNHMVGQTLRAGASVIDLGGGFCNLARYVSGRYVALDLQPWTSATIKADMNAGDFPDVGYFDVVVCQGLLEYINDPAAFLKAIRKYGKQLVLTYQLGPSPRRANAMTFEELRAILLDAGWHIESNAHVDMTGTQQLFACAKKYTGTPSYWWGEGKRQNWGDVFTAHLLKQQFGKSLELVTPQAADLFGCGSILEHIPNGYKGHVLGVGALHEETRRDLSQATGPVILRGRLTYNHCTLGNQDVMVGDLGLLAHLFAPASGPKKYGVGIIPHYADKDCDVVKEGLRSGMHFIDIEGGIQYVINEVSSCISVVSSSLHGLVVADALGVPNAWVELSDRVAGEGFKFADYYSVFGETPQPFKTLQDGMNNCRKHDVATIQRYLLAGVERAIQGMK